MKKRLSKEYVRRVKKVIWSKLSGGNMVNTINWWLVSLLRYSGGMVKWTKIELMNLDRNFLLYMKQMLAAYTSVVRKGGEG